MEQQQAMDSAEKYLHCRRRSYPYSLLLSSTRHQLFQFFKLVRLTCFRPTISPRQTKPNSLPFYDVHGTQLQEKTTPDGARIFSYAELYIATRGFSNNELLGCGGYGKVYRALLPSDGTLVAVKCVAKDGVLFERAFLAELTAMAKLRHRNLLRLKGWCVHENQLLLASDYMPNLSLDRVLFSSRGNLLGWDLRLNITRGLSSALYYLHDQLDVQIVHRDVKTSNVMLDSRYNCRLGDFGLARWREHGRSENRVSDVYTEQFRLVGDSMEGGTIGFVAPENMKRGEKEKLCGRTETKGDVFSFGVVVLEIVSGRRAVDLRYSDGEIVLLDYTRKLADEGKLVEIVDHRLPYYDGSCRLSRAEWVLHLALLCTLNDPNSRPTIKWVSHMLSSNLFEKLPSLPRFHLLPLYISLSSSSSSDRSTHTFSTDIITTTTITTTATTNGTSIYLTANEYEEPIKTPEGIASVRIPGEISYSEIVSATRNFSEGNKVGEVDFGVAYSGYLRGGEPVVVKRLGMVTCPALQLRFSKEVENLGRLRHRNLVQLRGWCREGGEMLVVYEKGGDRILSNILSGRGGMIMKWEDRYNLIKSLASGIRYLHEEWDEEVIHRNITSHSVSLDSEMNPKLGNFALAEFLSREEKSKEEEEEEEEGGGSVRGIFGYMAPEYVEKGKVRGSVDVYGFGVVVLEVVTGEMAMDYRQERVMLVERVRRKVEGRRRAVVEEIVDGRMEGEHEEGEVERVVRVGLACTCSDPERRPTMEEIVRMLDGGDEEVIDNQVEGAEEWRTKHGHAFSLVRRMKALGIH